ncbi:uncharacterized protein LOC126249377 [Schistocerca nitens]|uniref:uncharacterized protein LOC126249377 n=1 Tax=Schistocerca nitens TaxID=7011 RepID=UPI002117C831|nr:uncharacterized protein LOC126249377 [Schistocerca nitens]
MSSPCYRGPPRPGNAAAPQPPVSAAAATAVRSSPTELRDGTTRIPARCGGTYSLACARVSVSPVGGSHAANDAPPRGGAPNNEADCCCGVAQLLHSRIPTATDTAAINRRAGIFSRINSSEAARAQPVSDLQPRVYRSTFEWSRLGEAGAIAVATAPAPAAPSARRVAVRTKPQLPASLRPPATCTSAHAALDVADDEQPRPGAARRNALDRLQRFRLERSGRRSPAPCTPASAATAAGSAHAQSPSAAPPPAPPPHRKKPARTSDKTERLRELTEKLKGGERRPPPPPPPPWTSRRRTESTSGAWRAPARTRCQLRHRRQRLYHLRRRQVVP